MDDKVNPKHYEGKIQPIDLIESQDLDFSEGSIIKYVCRHKMKDGLTDLLKAEFYLQRLINSYKTETES